MRMRIFSIFRTFSRLTGALQRIAQCLEGVATSLAEIVHVHQELGPALGRLEALELSRAQFEAEMGALVLKAEGKFKAANNAEARERQLKKSYTNLAAELDLDGEGPETPEGDPVLTDDVVASPEERMQSLYLGVAPDDKKGAAVAAKWAR